MKKDLSASRLSEEVVLSLITFISCGDPLLNPTPIGASI